MIYNDGMSWSNISASQGPFSLLGGYYALDAHATWGGGNVKLQRLLGDGSTYVDVANTTISADGILAAVLIPPGRYKLVVTTASAVYAQLCRCPTQ